MEPSDQALGRDRDQIVDAALALADEIGWERVRLADVAAQLDLPLADIAAHFREKDDIGDAWLERADGRIIALAGLAGFLDIPVPERLHLAIMSWLDELAGHKAAARDILLYKLRPAHVHLMAALVVRLSRTVQWLREACGLNATGIRKQIEEIGLTSLFASTVIFWLSDRSAGQVRTRRFLRRGLARSDRFMMRVFR